METASIIFEIVRFVVVLLDIAILVGLIYVLPKAWSYRPKLFAAKHVPAKKIYMVRSEALRDRWNAAAKQFSAGTPEAVRGAIIEADTVADDALKEMGLMGEHMADRLASITAEDVTAVDGVWRAHRMRNDLVHTPGFSLSNEEAEQAMEGYRAFLTEIGILGDNS